MAKLVSKRYASGLFEAGLELNKSDEFKEEALFIKKVLSQEPDLKAVLEHPKIGKDEKKTILSNIFKDSISKEMLNFLYIVVDKRRERYIEDMFDYYMYLYNEEHNIVEATAITAVPMDEKEKKKLTVILSNKTGKSVKVKNVVKEDILGGVMLRIENKVMDGTVKGQLESLERSLKGMKV